MIIREAEIGDIRQMHLIRLSVKQNVLIDPNIISLNDYYRMITEDGIGWVCEIDNEIAGFAILDHRHKSVWGLFVHPEQEKKGIGKMLMDQLIDWAKEHELGEIWLSTDRNTRAEKFYTEGGWTKTGLLPNGEAKFELQL
jgi:GNAT superfamily N-acetyltransferase